MCIGREIGLSASECFEESSEEKKMVRLLPDETYEERSASSKRESVCLKNIDNELDEVEAAKALATFRKCDDFLKRYGIRPEFFCKHREKLALQTWLLQRSSSKCESGESRMKIFNKI